MNICAKTYLQKGTSRNPRSKVKLEMRRDVVYQMNSSIYEKKVRRRNCSMNSWRDEKQITFNSNHSFMSQLRAHLTPRSDVAVMKWKTVSWWEARMLKEKSTIYDQRLQNSYTHTHTHTKDRNQKKIFISNLCVLPWVCLHASTVCKSESNQHRSWQQTVLVFIHFTSFHSIKQKRFHLIREQ